MAIICNLKEILNKRGITIAELAKIVGITQANMSNIVNRKTASIGYNTLGKICEYLNLQPGDIFEYKIVKKRRVIPLFLDYTGTTDNLLKQGSENVKDFFSAIKELEVRSNCNVQITMVTGSSLESAKDKYKLLKALAENDGLPNLFSGVVAEYCGYWIKEDEITQLYSLDPRIAAKREEIEEIIKDNAGKFDYTVSTIYNISFDNISRANLDDVCEKIEKAIDCNEIEIVLNYDKYGQEIDIKHKKHTKSEAVFIILKKLMEKYEIPLVIIGGDSKIEDLSMYTENKDRILNMNVPIRFIAPANIREIASPDPDIIIGKWENAKGIIDCIEKIMQSVKIKGGMEKDE